ncbi:MAG: hypothetical protein AABX39_01365 [Nanoarchaeota archaeon]
MSLDEQVDRQSFAQRRFSTPLAAAKTGLIFGLISIPLTYIVDPANHKDGLEEFLKMTVSVALITPILLAGGVYVGQKIHNASVYLSDKMKGYFGEE